MLVLGFLTVLTSVLPRHVLVKLLRLFIGLLLARSVAKKSESE